MNIQITPNRLSVYIVILIISLNCTGVENLKGSTTVGFQPVDANQIPQILLMISAKVRNNYEKINTWQGEAGITTERIYEGEEAERIFNTYTDGIGKAPKILKKRREHASKFFIDTKKDFLYVNNIRKNPSEYRDFETGKDLGTKSRPWYETSILTPEYHLHCNPYALRKGVVVRNIAIKEKTEIHSACNRPPVFDPRENLIGGMPIWETFSLVLQYIDKHGDWNIDGHRLKVEEYAHDNTIRYRVQIPGIVSPGNYLIVTKTFSSKVGFNMTSVEDTNQDGILLQNKTWNYDLVDGVYIPSKITQKDFDPDGSLSYENTVTFKNQKINKPIPAETFTYKNLDLKNGDKFIDKILDKEYTYQDRQLIEVEKKSK